MRKNMQNEYLEIIMPKKEMVQQAYHKIADGIAHTMPMDFRRAIEGDRVVKKVWADGTPLARNEWMCWIIMSRFRYI